MSMKRQHTTNTSPRNTTGISDGKAAIDRAKAYLGFNDALMRSPSADQGNYEQNTVPFVSARFRGKTIWKVTLPNIVPSDLDSEQRGYDPTPFTFVASIDAQTGELISVDATKPHQDPDVLPEPSIAAAESDLHSVGERYEGIPTELPKVPLQRVIQNLGNISFAKELHAVYVLHSIHKKETKPVWAITLRGLPPIRPKGGDPDAVPTWQRNHLRYVVDSTTGEVLFITNLPQPEATKNSGHAPPPKSKP